MAHGSGRGRRPRMSYSPLTRVFREAFAANAEADARRMPLDEVVGERAERREHARRSAELRREREADDERTLSRRDLLKAAGVVGAAGLATKVMGPTRAQAATAPRIVIVGAGLAGVRCAHMLWSVKKLSSTIYEADTTHLGGRCWSIRNFFKYKQVGEHGGEFINTEHNAIRNLIKNLGLKTEIANGGDLPGLEEYFSIDGQHYTHADANADWSIAYKAFRRALNGAPWPQNYNTFTAEGQRLDNLTTAQWFDDPAYPELQQVGGSAGRFAKLCETDSIVEYGGDWQEQPSLNLLYLLAWNNQNEVEPLPGGDELYHVVGGNDQIITKMLAQLPSGTVKQGQQLVALRNNGNGTYTCSFQSGSKVTDVVADHVVLALPFSTLREVDLTQAGFSALKMKAINEMGMGHSAKLHLQTTSRPWAAAGLDGVVYTQPSGFQCCWDETVAQQSGPTPAQSPGILVNYPGGTLYFPPWTGSAAHGTAPSSDVTSFLNQIEPIFPGMKAAYNGVAYRDWWLQDPWHHGAYSFWKLGQYSGFSGYEQVQEGNVHFCGEHTSVDFQGFLNGAVDSGERAAKEVGV